jgi:hypothetical protein
MRKWCQTGGIYALLRAIHHFGHQTSLTVTSAIAWYLTQSNQFGRFNRFGRVTPHQLIGQYINQNATVYHRALVYGDNCKTNPGQTA